MLSGQVLHRIGVQAGRIFLTRVSLKNGCVSIAQVVGSTSATAWFAFSSTLQGIAIWTAPNITVQAARAEGSARSSWYSDPGGDALNQQQFMPTSSSSSRHHIFERQPCLFFVFEAEWDIDILWWCRGNWGGQPVLGGRSLFVDPLDPYGGVWSQRSVRLALPRCGLLLWGTLQDRRYPASCQRLCNGIPGHLEIMDFWLIFSLVFFCFF